MKNPTTRTRTEKSRRGTAMIEAAIALPLFLMILFGTAEFGLLFMRNQVLMNSTQQGARVASLARQNCSPALVRTEVENTVITAGSQLGMVIEAAHIDVTGACVPGGAVTVKVIYPYNLDLLEGFLSSPSANLSIPIGAEVMMLNES